MHQTAIAQLKLALQGGGFSSHGIWEKGGDKWETEAVKFEIVLENDVDEIYRSGYNYTDNLRRRVLKLDDVVAVFTELHIDVHGNHNSESALRKLVSFVSYCVNVAETVHNFIAACDHCQQVLATKQEENELRLQTHDRQVTWAINRARDTPMYDGPLVNINEETMNQIRRASQLMSDGRPNGSEASTSGNAANTGLKTPTFVNRRNFGKASKHGRRPADRTTSSSSPTIFGIFSPKSSAAKRPKSNNQPATLKTPVGGQRGGSPDPVPIFETRPAVVVVAEENDVGVLRDNDERGDAVTTVKRPGALVVESNGSVNKTAATTSKPPTQDKEATDTKPMVKKGKSKGGIPLPDTPLAKRPDGSTSMYTVLSHQRHLESTRRGEASSTAEDVMRVRSGPKLKSNVLTADIFSEWSCIYKRMPASKGKFNYLLTAMDTGTNYIRMKATKGIHYHDWFRLITREVYDNYRHLVAEIILRPDLHKDNNRALEVMLRALNDGHEVPAVTSRPLDHVIWEVPNLLAAAIDRSVDANPFMGDNWTDYVQTICKTINDDRDAVEPFGKTYHWAEKDQVTAVNDDAIIDLTVDEAEEN